MPVARNTQRYLIEEGEWPPVEDAPPADAPPAEDPPPAA